MATSKRQVLCRKHTWSRLGRLQKTYKRFLPYINNEYDFRDMLGELLGELNASHTGARYHGESPSLTTATLGLFFDNAYDGDGLKSGRSY